MKKFYWLALALLFIWQLASQVWKQFDPKVYVVFCDVGQGDATLIYQGRTQVLVDAGPNDQVLGCLASHLPWFDRRLEMIVNTHPEQDHLGGIPAILERYQVGILVTNGATNDTKTWARLTHLIEQEKIRTFTTKSGDQLRLGALSFATLWPSVEVLSGSKTELNKLSVVLRFDYKSFILLLTGDIGEEEELALLDNSLLTKVAVLKVPHHGSKFSSSADFINRISPQLAVIEVGANNRFGHPTREALMRLEAVGARIKRTDQDGAVTLVTNGQKYWLK